MLLKHPSLMALLAAVLASSTAVAQSSPVITDPAAVTAGRHIVEPGHTRVQFSVSHMGFNNWYGDLTNASGSLVLDPNNPAAAKLDIMLPVASLSTTDAKLDGELRGAQRFDAVNYPTIRFVSTRIVRDGARAVR